VPTQIVPAASLRNIIRLPADRVLVWSSNYLILIVLWSIGRAIFRVEWNFLPALREGRTVRQPSTSRNLGRGAPSPGNDGKADRIAEMRSTERGEACYRGETGELSATPERLRQSLAEGYAWRETP